MLRNRDLSEAEEVKLIREEIFPLCGPENPCRLMAVAFSDT